MFLIIGSITDYSGKKTTNVHKMLCVLLRAACGAASQM